MIRRYPHCVIVFIYDKQIKSNLIGQKKPNFYLTPLNGYEIPQEKHLNIADFKLINFWASWCAPCRAEHGTLMSIQKSGYRIIGINYKDASSKAEEFLTELGNPYIAIGSDEIPRANVIETAVSHRWQNSATGAVSQSATLAKASLCRVFILAERPR